MLVFENRTRKVKTSKQEEERKKGSQKVYIYWKEVKNNVFVFVCECVRESASFSLNLRSGVCGLVRCVQRKRRTPSYCPRRFEIFSQA